MPTDPMPTDPAIPIDRTAAALQHGITHGMHVGAQLFVARAGGQVIADVAVGDARPGVPMRPDTLMIWMSSTKAVVAVAAAQLWERGLLELDEPVARHIPEFGTRGKEAVTVRHVLTHTAGFRGLAGEWERQPWDAVVAAVCDARLEPGWEPGRKAGYHVATSWYVLGELVRRLDGRPFDRYVREAIFGPLGMTESWVGMPPDRYRAYGDRIGLMHDTAGASPTADLFWDTEAGAALCRPAGNGRGPARELGRFYVALLNRGTWGGARVQAAQAVEAITAPHRVGLYDHTFRHTMDWGLGFMVNSNRYGPGSAPYGFGPHAADRAFGHSGHQSSTAFADPEHGLAVALVLNGMPGEARHHARMREILSALYEDLGLARAQA
jgi:CubicO group peptidase (beta-lactamase class C family)